MVQTYTKRLCSKFLQCWEQVDRRADNGLQQAGTIVTMLSVRNWRSQAQKACKMGYYDPHVSKACGPYVHQATLLQLASVLGTNGPTCRQRAAASRNDCHHAVCEELEIPSAKNMQNGYYDPHVSKACGPYVHQATLLQLASVLGTNGPTCRQRAAASRNDCHHAVCEELEIPSAKGMQNGVL